MKLSRYAAIAALVCAMWSCFSLAQNEPKTTPSFRDILNLTKIGEVEISPDGNLVAYTLTVVNWDKNRYETQIWLLDVSNGNCRQITHNEKSSSNIVWSPDGTQLAFVSSRDGKSQVYVLPIGGGEAQAITRSNSGIGSYSWSPDGQTIAYTAPDDLSREKEAREQEFGSFTIYEEEHNVNHLWLCRVETGETTRIIGDENMHVGSFNWKPDGTEIAFSARPRTITESPLKNDIYVYSIENESVTKKVGLTGSDYRPRWSPDGTRLVFTTSMGMDSFFKASHLAELDIDSGEITDLTPDFGEDPSLIGWIGNRIYFTAIQGVDVHLFVIEDGRHIKQLTSGDGVYANISFSADGGTVAYTFRDAGTYTDIHVTSSATFAHNRKTSFDDLLDNWSLSSKELIRWKSTDGVEITGVLMKPADYDPGRKYPLMVIIHGGPHDVSIPAKIDYLNDRYPIEQWAAKGALILEPNYRGGLGFGEKFRSLNYRNLGIGDYQDVISGVDHLIEQGHVDSERVAAMGWSQGGYVAAFITTYSDRFAAVSVGAGISDWVEYYYRSDSVTFCPEYLGNTPWVDPEIYARTSPITYINNARTPTLIQHGEFDGRVPINNAYKLYRGLKDSGVDVRFIIYKGFGHRINKPKEKLATLTHNWQWFGKYIWGEESN